MARTSQSAAPVANEPLRVLVIDDDRFHAETVAEVLEKVGNQVTVATSGKTGADSIDRDEFDVVLTDLRMSGIDGLAIVRKAREEQPEAEVVVMTGFGDVKTAVEAMKLGALHYLQKPLDMAEVRAITPRRSGLKRANSVIISSVKPSLK